ncbi:MAG: hypothetical protein KZQ91_04155 [Candidatus Thiodiazotropha sp. (ex Lucinoma borealis)]|nr:hypothetical protein [Candidatus Thiodiazotropha sp. (ex Lucinoma borealis)]
MQIFTEKNELIYFANMFVTTRVEALEKDVAHCMCEPYAPFPAIVYCFSTVDLLGALSAGDASNNAPTSQQSIDYMRRFMHYTDEQTKLLMKIFRHKIVHLAQPKTVSEYNGKKVAWRYWHDNAEHHLKLTKTKEPSQLLLTSAWTITADHKFDISIAHFVKDITRSVQEPGGYLNTLLTDTVLQDCFEKALSEIYG